MIKLNGEEIKFGNFPDGTPLFKYNPAALGTAYIEWQYNSNEEMVFLMFLTRHLQTHNVERINLIMPYIPNARQDRVKNIDEAFTLKYFAEFINGLNFDKVYVLDPHSPVSEALINNICLLPLTYYDKAMIVIRSYEPNVPTTVFYPDEGAMKRYAKDSNEYTFGVKQRDFATGKITSFDVVGNREYIKGCNVVIVDDICSYGGTIYHSAKKLKELGAKKIYVCITHCEDSIAKGELLKGDLIEKIFTTDSTLTFRHDKIQVIPYDED